MTQQFSRSFIQRALILAVAAACSGIDATAPKIVSGGGAANNRSANSYHGSVVQRSVPLRDDLSASAIITAAGGSLEIPRAGLLVVIPEGALSSSTRVSVTAARGKRVVYSFEPHGTVF